MKINYLRLYTIYLVALFLPYACSARKEMFASDPAMPIDTSTTAELPPEVYGRYYKLEDVVRLDARLQPIPRPAKADGMWYGGNPYDLYNVPKLIMFTPGMSHIDYALQDPEHYLFPGSDRPPTYGAYRAKSKDLLILVSDTTCIKDSIITTSLRTWNEGQIWHERRSWFRLLHADSSRLVIRVGYRRQDSIPRYNLPNYEEMFYRYVPQDSVFAGRTAVFFPSHEAADDYLVPTEGLSLRELGERRYPPYILRPDTLRVGAQGGESTLVRSIGAYEMYGFSSYEGAQRADSIAGKYFSYPKDRSFSFVDRRLHWVACNNFLQKKFEVIVLPNEDARPRRMEIFMKGDTKLTSRYFAIGRPHPTGRLVILQDGAQGDPSTSAK